MLDKLLKKLGTGELAGKVARYREICNEVACQERKKVEAEQDYVDILADLNRSIRGIQQTCDHPIITRYPDASGGNDSSTVCDVCGKEV